LGAKALYNAASLAYQDMGDSLLAQDYLDRLIEAFGTTDSSQIHEEEIDLDIESIE
jgi:hypothetical protein